jgi:hypothetical protein
MDNKYEKYNYNLYPNKSYLGDVKLCYNLPNYTFLKNRNVTRTFISPEGKIYDCRKHGHDHLCREIVFNDYLDEYIKLDKSCFDNKPLGMLQEEYFLLYYKNFIKVTCDYGNVLFFYHTLSNKQTEIIYPK